MLLVILSLTLTLVSNQNIVCVSDPINDSNKSNELLKKLIISNISDDTFSQNSDSEEYATDAPKSSADFESAQNDLFNVKTRAVSLNNQNLNDKNMLCTSFSILKSDCYMNDRKFVKHYEFRDNKFGDPGACYLAVGIGLNYKLLSLDIRGNNISNIGFSALGASVTRAKKFESFKYSSTPYDETLLQAIFKYCTYSIRNLNDNDHEIIFTKLPCNEDYDQNDDVSRVDDKDNKNNESDHSCGDTASDDI